MYMCENVMVYTYMHVHICEEPMCVRMWYGITEYVYELCTYECYCVCIFM